MREMLMGMAETWLYKNVVEMSLTDVLPFYDGVAYGAMMDMRDLRNHIARARRYENPWKICRSSKHQQCPISPGEESQRAERAPERCIFGIKKETSSSPVRNEFGQECSLITVESSISAIERDHQQDPDH